MTTEQFIREFEHTDNAAIEVEAPSRRDLFACAAIGLARIMVAPDGIANRETRTIEVYGDCDDDLMYDALTDALDLFVSEGFIWREAAVEELRDGIALKLTGEEFDRRRHQMFTEIKAVTYHQSSIEHADDGWKARIVFEV